jgi:hypothetical protein
MGGRTRRDRRPRPLAGAALAALVSVAPARAEGVAQALVCRDAGGRTRLVAAAERPPGPCLPAQLPVGLSDIRWAHWVPGTPPAADPQIALEGSGRGDAFAPASARVLAPPSGRQRGPALPLGINLLPRLGPKPFGIEERAAFRRDGDGVTVTCRPGRRAAGVILDPAEARLPEGAAYRVRAAADGSPGFSFGFTVRGAALDRFDALAPTATLLAAPADRAVRERPWPVLLCPESGGELSVRALELVPEPARSGAPERSAWAWRPALWRDDPGGLVGRARAERMGRLFVAVETDGGRLRDEAAFAHFVALARASGIETVVVEGDPGMALDEGRAVALSRLEALLAYQARAVPDARFAGIQYDIEPYILPGYAAAPQPILQGWAGTVRALAARAGPLPLDLVLPFWLAGDEAAAGIVLPAIRESAASVTVMAYRTSDAAIQAAAEPLLAWGAAAGKPVRVALETGPVADETSRVYAKSHAGNMVAVPAGGGTLILLLGRSIKPLTGQAFSLKRETVAPAGQVSFLGDGARLEATADALAAVLPAWRSFSGLAFHGLIQ